MAKSSTAPNPFATAVAKPTAKAKKVQGNILVAGDITTYNGGKYTKQQVIEAIQAYAKGHRMAHDGEAMKEASRGTIHAVSRTHQANRWLMDGSRPNNPKLFTNNDGSGEFVTVIFQDSVAKLDEERYASLANLIGVEAAEENTIKRDDFLINPELLGEKCKVVVDGKTQEMTVMDAVGAALQAAFAPSPHILANLFQRVSKFETLKGLIDKGLSLVTRDKSPVSALKLAQFLEVGRFVTQIKPGGSAVDSD